MTGPLILIVFVAGGDADDPTVGAMLQAMREAGGAGSRVEVRDMREAPSDTAVVAVEESLHADAVVELSWNEGAHREALLRVHVAPAGPWVERSIRFATEDADAEQGRTLGFAIASILPDREDARPEPAHPAPPPKDIAGAPPFAPLAAPRLAGRPVRLELRALATIGSGGLSGDVGGEAAAEWRALGSLGVRAGAGAIAGSVSDAFVSATTLRFAAGFTWHPFPLSALRRWDVSVAPEYVLERLSATYTSPGSTSSTRARWLSGAGLGVDLRWLAATNLEVLAGIGVDDVFSPTYIVVRGLPAKTLPAVRGLGSFGLAIGF
jgi:hypothetical protein